MQMVRDEPSYRPIWLGGGNVLCSQERPIKYAGGRLTPPRICCLGLGHSRYGVHQYDTNVGGPGLQFVTLG